MSNFQFQLKEDGREERGRGRTGKSEVKVPDEKCQLEMVYNEDVSLSSQSSDEGIVFPCDHSL